MGCMCSGLAQMYGWHPVPENLPAPVFLAAVAATIVPAAFFTTMAWPVEVKSNRPWGQRALHRLGRTVLFVLSCPVLPQEIMGRFKMKRVSKHWLSSLS